MTKKTPLRERMIQDMELAGLTPRTQQTYIYAVRKLAAHYRRAFESGGPS
ncbi:MAG: phage integrase N-terminal SAM-like domain-containing protein [Magnetococcales bacterium]|nr:phage integrase N-terminal SAM-like domain-containing protein [Magnetococcales bacterium]